MRRSNALSQAVQTPLTGEPKSSVRTGLVIFAVAIVIVNFALTGIVESHEAKRFIILATGPLFGMLLLYPMIVRHGLDKVGTDKNAEDLFGAFIAAFIGMAMTYTLGSVIYGNLNPLWMLVFLAVPAGIRSLGRALRA